MGTLLVVRQGTFAVAFHKYFAKGGPERKQGTIREKCSKN
jgi:hypothetical protein